MAKRSTYDADGERLTRTATGVTTVYVAGLYEEDRPTGTTRALYQFNGQIIAQRSSDSSGLIYLHADHLGSVSLATTASGAVVSRQEFDPWGNIRSGGISQTALNYTGQRRDGTGLLYYHARYYDPVLGRFISADTIVPGSGALTLWPSDATATPLFAQANAPGPQHPQELNRYSYVNNNPVRHTDSTGHLIDTLLDVGFIAYGIYDIAANGYTTAKGLALAADVGSALIPGVTGGGTAVRALAHADDVAKAVTKVDGVAQIATRGDNAANAGKALAGKGKDITSRPSGFRKQTVQDAWDNAADGPTGGKLCPTCGQEVKVPPHQKTRRDWDVDHQPPWSKRDKSRFKTRKEVIDNYNEGTRLECPSCNRARGNR